jgi:hypothetical protein
VTGSPSASTARVETGVFDYPLVLTADLEGQRAELRSALRDAQRRLVRFAATHGWLAHVEMPFATEARIFGTKAGFDRDVIALTGAPPATILPKSYSAALEGDVLVSVSPALYAANTPQGAQTGEFEKLLTHEFAHRLHIRLLDGHEDDMGPMWFFEGFACYAAGQFSDDLTEPDKALLGKVLGATSRGGYAEYAKVFRFFARKVALPDLIAEPRKPTFASWAKNQAAQ